MDELFSRQPLEMAGPVMLPPLPPPATRSQSVQPAGHGRQSIAPGGGCSQQNTTAVNARHMNKMDHTMEVRMESERHTGGAASPSRNPPVGTQTCRNGKR